MNIENAASRAMTLICMRQVAVDNSSGGDQLRTAGDRTSQVEHSVPAQLPTLLPVMRKGSGFETRVTS
jgi:hypothetical protein